MDAVEQVLVGVDGSEPATRALRWALDEARCRGARLMVLLVVDPADLSDHEVPRWEPDDLLAESTSRLDAIVESVVDGDARVDIEQRVESGDPRRMLRDWSEDVDLLVVGSRGHGEITGLLVGSVGQYLVTHARCPVTVVRPTSADREP